MISEANNSRPTLFFVTVEVASLTGQVALSAMVDSGAQGNFVHPRVAKEFLPAPSGKVARVKAVYGHEVLSFRRYGVRFNVMDSNTKALTFQQDFHAVTMQGTDVILGMPWLRQAKPDINWLTGTFQFHTTGKASDIEINDANVAMALVEDGAPAYLRSTTSLDDAGEIPTFSARLQLTDMQPTAAQSRIEELGMTKDGKALPEKYWDSAELFSESKASELPLHGNYDHTIDLMPRQTPPHRPVYSLSHRELEVLREYIESALARGWIRPSKSPAGAPVMFVPKKDGSLRLCSAFVLTTGDSTRSR